MKKVYLFIIAAIIMTMPDMAKAQNDYRQAVREYLESNPQYPVIIEQISNSFAKHLKSFNQQILLDKKADGEQIADKYNKEQMVDDLYDLLIVPAFSDNISAEEIRQISTILNTAEGKVCLKKSEAMKQSLIKNLYGELMKQIVANGGKNIKQENFKIEPVQPYTGCTNEYKELAEKYFEINRNDVVKAFDLSYDRLKKRIGNDENSEKKKKTFDQLCEYIKSNLKVMMLNALFESFTIDELRFCIKIEEMPVFFKLSKVSMSIITNINSQDYRKTLVQKWQERYVSWLKKQNIKVKDV